MRALDLLRLAVPTPLVGKSSSPLRRLFCLLVAALAVLAPAPALAATYYVAPGGSDSATGGINSPFATLQKANDVSTAGDTIYLRGGTYAVTKQIKLSHSGSSDAMRIKYFAYQGEKPVFDCTNYVTTNAAADVPAILVTGNWLHLRGFEIKGVKVQASGAHSISALRSEGASNNTFELLDIHNNFGPGLFISKGTGGNLILNCDSHDNYDKAGSQGDGQNADGFGVHYQTTGPSTVIRGCRAWMNSDDGYDLISQEVPVLIDDSWAIQNGYADGGATNPSAGNGNGFKAGSSQTGIRHIIQKSVAWKNKAAGFYANHSSGGNTWLNNTAYKNGVQYNMLASPAGDSTQTITLTGSLAHKMRNNVGFPNKNTNMGGVDSQLNTWDLAIAETATTFESTTDTGSTGARQADGSLPDIAFLKLRNGSPLIDKGTDVGLPYEGSKPDLGAYEYGEETNSGTGGSGSGGAASTGGASGSGGSVSTGGTASTGGSNGSGGAVSTGGTVSAGGTVSTGGADGSGGDTTGAGGDIIGVGGDLSGIGGDATGAGGTATGAGGLVSAGGTFSGAGGTGTSTGGFVSGTGGTAEDPLGDGSTEGDDVSEAEGCSCRTAGGGRTNDAGLALFAMALGGVVIAARRQRRTVGL